MTATPPSSLSNCKSGPVWQDFKGRKKGRRKSEEGLGSGLAKQHSPPAKKDTPVLIAGCQSQRVNQTVMVAPMTVGSRRVALFGHLAGFWCGAAPGMSGQENRWPTGCGRLCEFDGVPASRRWKIWLDGSTAALGRLSPKAAHGHKRKFRLMSPTVSCSAEAAAGNLADHFRYGFVTGHRPGNLTERQLSDFLCGRPQP
jgi:hypothetical protein